MTERTVYFLQPYVASYRFEFYNELQNSLQQSGWRLVVLTSEVTGLQRSRGDAIHLGEVERQVRQIRITLRGRSIYFRILPRINDFDVIVCELDVGNLNAWSRVFRRGRGRTVLWGHGRSYVNADSRLTTRMRDVLIRKADGIATYTASAAEYIQAGEAGRGKVIQAIGNAPNLRKLISADLACTQIDVEHYRRASGLSDRRCFLYVGAIDRTKNIELLLNVALEANRIDSSFLLLVCGEGRDADSVDWSRPGIKRMGRVDETQFALLARISTSLFVAGRIGLVAVEAAALGLPIFGVRDQNHAPELDQLDEGKDYVLASGNARALASQLLQIPYPRHELVRDYEQLLVSPRTMAQAFARILNRVGDN